MAFGATLTLTVNSVAKVLNRINQDNFGSEYYLRASTEEYRMKIRHSKESPQVDGRYFDRHNVEVTHTVFASGGNPAVTKVFTTNNRVLSTDDVTNAGYLNAAVLAYLASGTVQADLLTWQS